MNIVYNDPWFDKIDDVFVVCKTKELCLVCAQFYMIDNSEWKAHCLRAGRVIAATTTEKLDIREAAVFLISHLMTMRQDDYYGLIMPGLLNDGDFRSIQDKVQKETSFASGLAEKAEGCSRIVRTARKLNLHPVPTGYDRYLWNARCPRFPANTLLLSTKHAFFVCTTCRTSGNTNVLTKLFKEVVDGVFARTEQLIDNKAGSIDNIRELRPTVYWYYELCECELKLNKAQWRKISSGCPFEEEGGHYQCDEDSGQSYWCFNQEAPGSLVVVGEDAGTLFDGIIDEVTIEVK